MKKVLLPVILLVFLLPLKAQEFIGLTEKSVRETISRNNPDLVPDNTVRNDTYRYLKYHSRNDKETWLIFIDGKGRCNGVRITCGNELYEEKMRELNEKYHPEGTDTWSYSAGNEKITVKVHRDAWFFTITHELIHHN